MRGLLISLLFAIATATLVVTPDEATASLSQGCEATERGYRCLYGPIDLSSGTAMHDGRVPAPPVPGYITSARAVVVDEEGDRIPRHAVHLHHSGWLKPEAAHLGCEGALHEPIYGTGKEVTRMKLPEGYGDYWDPSASLDPPETAWHMYSELNVMHEGAVKTAFIRLNLGFVPVEHSMLTDVRTIWWGVLGCNAGQGFVVPKGSGENGKLKVSYDYEMPATGRFIWMAGHLHDGGYRLKLFNITTGTPVVGSEAVYASHGDPWDLTTTTIYSDATGVAVVKGDVLRLTAAYDSSRRRDGMGLMRAVVAIP